MAAAPEYKTVRIHADTYDVLRQIEQEVARRGWAHVGADRSDAVTLLSLIDEGVRSLLRSSQHGRKGR